MKKIFRMIIFSAVAIFLTSQWNKGFIIKLDWTVYLKASLLIAFIYYLIVPFSKLILLPLNILTLGLMSLVVYCLLFYFLANYFSLIEIKNSTLMAYKFTKTANIFISAISVSTIINLLERIL